MESYHIYTAKRYVLREINSQMQDLGGFKFDILVIQNKGDKVADRPESYEELEKLLEGVDKVYSFDRVETSLHGAIGYDIIING